MPRLTVKLQQEERDALLYMAQQERRHPQQQAGLLIRHGLETAGYLERDAAALQAQTTEQEAGNAAAKGAG